jgi:Thiamine pyrophosphate enzyme, N-terminal TPP binding domain
MTDGPGGRSRRRHRASDPPGQHPSADAGNWRASSAPVGFVPAMTGARSLIHALAESRADVCFANPGTSEMHFVAALDDVDEMRAVLGLFEGVVNGAADGYGRMTERPAAALLHLGPGLGNGIANLHNARRPHADGGRRRRPRHLSPAVRRASPVRRRLPRQDRLEVDPGLFCPTAAGSCVIACPRTQPVQCSPRSRWRVDEIACT